MFIRSVGNHRQEVTRVIRLEWHLSWSNETNKSESSPSLTTQSHDGKCGIQCFYGVPTNLGLKSQLNFQFNTESHRWTCVSWVAPLSNRSARPPRPSLFLLQSYLFERRVSRAALHLPTSQMQNPVFVSPDVTSGSQHTSTRPVRPQGYDWWFQTGCRETTRDLRASW